MGTMTIRKGDNVEVITGKDKGKRGKVIRSVPDKNRVVVEGINKIKKASRPTQRNPQSGGIIEMEAPIHVSNLMLVCGSCGKPTRAGIVRDDEGGRTRTCKKCGASIDKK
jgi:large subunit ribosomal protein L24